MELARELEAALEAARAGAGEALRRFRGTYASRRKADGTWVTEADEGSERAVRAVLAEAFPDHNLHGEEEGLAQQDPDAPTWVIDPIDATANFISGIPVWATLVGLRVADEAVVGVVCAPALGEEYAAARGGGATCNGEAIAVHPVGSLEEAQVLFADVDLLLERVPGFPALVRRAARDRGLGDFWGHVLVARGAAQVMVEAANLSLWDVTALEPIVAEAGGRLTALDGTPWSKEGPVLTSCGGPLHDEAVSLLAAR